MKGIDGLWGLYWRAPGPVALHALPLVEVLRKNSKSAVTGGDGFLVLAGVHGSLEEALEYKRYLRELRKGQNHEASAGSGEVSGVRVQVSGEEASEPVPGVRGGE
jgi:hypothetical protein